VNAIIKDTYNQPKVSAIQKKKMLVLFLWRASSQLLLAREAVSKKCDKKGHFLKICRSKTKSDWTSGSVNWVSSIVPGFLYKAIIRVKVNKIDAHTLIDSSSSKSFINEEFVWILKIKSYSENG